MTDNEKPPPGWDVAVGAALDVVLSADCFPDFAYDGDRAPSSVRDRVRGDNVEVMGRALAAAWPVLAAALADQIDAERAKHFAEYGNEETGPRNYDWAMTHAADLVRAASVPTQGETE